MDEPSVPVEIELRHGLEDLHRHAQAVTKMPEPKYNFERQLEQRCNRFDIDWTERLKNDRSAELRGSAGIPNSLATAGYQLSPAAGAAFAGSITELQELAINEKYDQLERGLKRAIDEIGKGNAPDLDFTVLSPPLRDEPVHEKANEAMLAMARAMLAATPEAETKPKRVRDM